MRLLRPLVVSMFLLGGNLYAQTGAYWFSLHPDDPTPVTCIMVSEGDQLTLYAWLLADSPDWGWIGGFTFPICYDEDYIEVTAMDRTSLLDPYMFKGVRWLGDSLGQNPGQAMWFAAVCFSGCMLADGTPHNIGSITFNVLQEPPPYDCFTVIDTCMYPPSNYASMGNESGTETIYPDWEPFGILFPDDVAEKSSQVDYSLRIVGPNPLRGVTSLSYGLPRKAQVNISLYDVTGRLVRILVTGIKDAGTYTIEWDGRDNVGRSLSSGAYFLRMTTGKFRAMKRMVMIR